MSEDVFKYIIARIVQKAEIAANDYLENKEDKFLSGIKFGYWEVLDMIKTELEIEEQDISEYGLDENFVNNLLTK
jgi:hypothetical protein